MKQFAKSLVSVVIALSILATMCVVGFSAVAGTPTTEDKTFVMIPETGTKAAEDMHKTHADNATGDFAVVDASTLTGGDTGLASGVKAYKANVTKGIGKDGFWVYTQDTDFGDFYYNTTDNYLDAWIYVSDISKVNNIIIRFYVAISDYWTATNGTASYADNYIYQVGGAALGLKTGWTHVQFQMNTTNSWQNNNQWDTLFAGNGGKVLGVGIHDHSGAKEDYTLAVASMKVTNKEKLGDKTDKDYLVTATAKENGVLAHAGTLGTDTYNGGSKGAYAQTDVVAVKKLFPAKDLSADGTKVSVWMYVQDPSKANDVVIELGATPNDDKAELQYIVAKADLKQGWNEYVIDTGKVVNGAYLNNICRLRIFSTFVAEAGIKIGEVYATHPASVPETPDTYQFMVNSSEATTTPNNAWDAENKQEGAASITLSNTAAGTKTAEVKLAKIDVDDNWVGYFWLYVDDPTVVKELFWELSSSHAANNNAVRYIQQAAKNQLTYLKAGWNKVEFKIHTTVDLEANSKATDKSNSYADHYTYYRGGQMFGNLNLDALNYVRVAVNFAKAGSVKLNAFTLCDPVTLLPTDKDYILSDSKYEEVLVGEYEDATYDEGTGAYTNATPADGAIKVRVQKVFEAKDLTNKYITTWIYVDDPSKIGYIEYEVTSSGKADVEETAFIVNPTTNANVLKAGWNKVILNPHANAATESNMIAKKGSLDVTKANFIRVHTKGAVDFKLGATYVSDIPTQEDEKTSYTVFVDPDAETNVNSGTWDTEDKQEGKASYKMNTNAATAPNLTISAEEGWKGYLWVYIDDVTKVGELFWEISSDNDCKGACVRYIKRQASGTMADLKNGWNKIEFELHDSTGLADTYNKFDHAVAKSFSDKYYYYLGNNMTGNVDWANINYVRVIAQPANGGGATVKVNAFTIYKPVVEPEKDENTVGTTILSANKAKDASAIGSANGGVGSVVKTSDLKGGQSGVPSKEAYKVALNGQKVGIALPVENTDWSKAAAAKVDDTHALKDYGVNMWLWVSDASKVDNLVVRFFEEGQRNGVDGWTYQWNISFKKSANFQNGWNNVTLWFPSNTTADYDHRGSLNTDGTTITEFTIHDHGTTPDYEVAIACARLVTTSDDTTAGWVATGDAVNVAIIVVAVLLAAMAASVTVYFGKKAR